MQAPARTEHLVSKTELEEAGEWNEGVSVGIISQDVIDANWKLPVDILVCPDKYVNDSWCNVVSVSETDEGYVVEFD